MKRDYYIEFYEAVELILNDYVRNNGLPVCVKTVLFEGSYALKHEYNEQRKSGVSRASAEDCLRQQIIPEHEINLGAVKTESRIDLSIYIGGLGNRIIFYIYNNRQLRYLLPVIRSINRPILLLCEPCVDLEVEVPEYVVAIELALSLVEEEAEPTLPKPLVKIRNYYALLESIFDNINAEGVVVLEGCHFQEQILGDIAGSLGIPAIAIQQGWPSFMHSMFRGFPYSHFLTWGRRFDELWKMHNPAPRYIAVGYPFDIKRRNATDGIAFFLQVPLFISDKVYFDELIGLISSTAKKYPSRYIIVREHPEFRLSPGVLGELTGYENVIIASDWALEKAYSHSAVVVSHFSSSIMECMAHGCIPIVYDPTEGSAYNPDIQDLGLGEVAKIPDEFFKSIDHIFEISELIHCNIQREIDNWFSAIGENALERIIKNINNIAPPSQAHGKSKLNLGCGRNLIDGWLNCDLFAVYPGVFQMDAGENYPFQDNSFEFIFSEHMFEHLTLHQQTNMLRECHRILKSRGIMRMAMPNMHFLMNLYNYPGDEVNRRYINWSFNTFISPKCQVDVSIENKVTYVVNNFMRDWGHKFIHTPESIVEMCKQIGFCDISICKIGESSNPELRRLENHAKEIPQWANEVETLVIEITKP